MDSALSNISQGDQESTASQDFTYHVVLVRDVYDQETIFRLYYNSATTDPLIVPDGNFGIQDEVLQFHSWTGQVDSFHYQMNQLIAASYTEMGGDMEGVIATMPLRLNSKWPEVSFEYRDHTTLQHRTLEAAKDVAQELSWISRGIQRNVTESLGSCCRRRDKRATSLGREDHTPGPSSAGNSSETTHAGTPASVAPGPVVNLRHRIAAASSSSVNEAARDPDDTDNSVTVGHSAPIWM